MPTQSSSSSFCEVCGRQVSDNLTVVVIEGTIFRVCFQCSKRGKPYNPLITKNIKPSTHLSTKSTFRQPLVKNQPIIKKRGYPTNRIQLTDETFLSHDFGRMIREARMKKGFTHEQLALKMSEKASLLKKIETGALKPDELLAKKLERYLQIRLYISADDE
ncbi:MAG: multiprotein bridging factor aMBF1 [Nitrososphaeraceae archaeon]